MPSETTANLELPFILPSQAQKHVTHNEALQRLDLLTQLTISAIRQAPPSTPREGEVFIVSDGATGLWQGQSGALAAWQDGYWTFVAPVAGWRAWLVEDEACLYFDGEIWRPLPLPDEASFEQVGVGATADATNRLAVASPASLFTHTGSGHRLTVNKAGPSATASLLFQSDWTGCAEMGLAGEDSFSIKVNGPDTGWRTALRISPEGHVRMDQRPFARVSLSQPSLTLAAGSFTGFDQWHLAGGGMTFGNTVAAGRGSALRIPAAGLYMVVLSVSTPSTSLQTVSVSLDGTADLLTHAGSAGTSGISGILWLDAGHDLSLRHASAGQFSFGYGSTELSLVMI